MKAIAALYGRYPMTGEIILYIWTRVTKINQRFRRLAALIEAGKLRPERFSWPRPPKVPLPGDLASRPDPGAGRAPMDPAIKWLFQWQFAWLCRVMPSRFDAFGAAQFGGQLRHLLGDPEMQALLSATPRMRKLLRPLCWMLGVEMTLLRPVISAPPPICDAPRNIVETARDGTAFIADAVATLMPPNTSPPNVAPPTPPPSTRARAETADAREFFALA